MLPTLHTILPTDVQERVARFNLTSVCPCNIVLQMLYIVYPANITKFDLAFVFVLGTMQHP